MISVNVPDEILAEAKRISRIASDDEVIATALREFVSNRDQKKLIKYLGTFSDDFMADDECCGADEHE
jgi:metal-responsive CopG/Arc/MetJ family transcriptional regulator